MRKLLTLASIGLLLAAPAGAAYKCAPAWGTQFYPYTTWAGGGATGKTNFSIIYANGAPYEMTMDGVAHCSSQQPNANTTAGMVSDLAMEGGAYCWCRFVSPAVSNWIPITDSNINSVVTCNSNCAAVCGTYLRSDTGKTTYGSNFVAKVWGTL